MMSLKVIVLAPLLIFGIPSATIRKAKADFENVNKVFTAQKLSVEMIYNFYEQHDSHEPVDSKQGVFYKKGDSDYSKLMDTETLHNSEFTITSQLEDRIMVVSDPISYRNKLSIGVDTLLTFCKNITVTEIEGGNRKYELTFNQGSVSEFKKLEMTFETATYRLKKVSMYFWEQDKVKENGETEKINPKVEITYKNYNKVNPDNLNVFSGSNYVTKIGSNKYKTAGKYTSYKIYNQKLR